MFIWPGEHLISFTMVTQGSKTTLYKSQTRERLVIKPDRFIIELCVITDDGQYN
jgi:hypothetical protein